MRYKLALVMLLPFIAKAVSLPYLVIEKVNGVEDMFVLEDMPVITINDDELMVRTDQMTVTYKIDEVKNYHFSSATQDISDVPVSNALRFVGHEVIEINDADITQITLTDINGVTLLTMPNGNGQINLTQYPTGTYILTIYKSDGNQSVKFVK